MPKMDLIFVSSGRHVLTEGLIRGVTGSDYAHAAVGIEIEGAYRIVEAVSPAIRCSPADIFDNAKNLQKISVEITEEQRRNVANEALRLVGRPYGKDDCIIGGAHDVFGNTAASALNGILDDADSLNCSGTQTCLIRKAFTEYMQNIDESTVTQEAARKYALEFFPNAEITTIG